LAIAVLSALAGALLTWLVTYLTGGAQDTVAPRSPREEGAPTDDLLRVVRTKGDPAVFVQGKRVNHLRDIQDRDIGQQTVLAIKAVLAFAEGWLPALQEERGSPDATRQRSAADARPAPAPMPENLVIAERDRGASLSEPLKLVEEIDALIQRRLQERPDLAKHRLRLTRDVHGHPLIYVGQQRYRSADEIPDDEVRAFIQETIQIWENQ
jgi:hypothetical protein